MKKSFDKKIVERLKEMRIKSKLTQKEVADKMGLTRTAISNYENGIREVSIIIFEKLSNIYKCNPAYMAGWSNSKKKTKNSIKSF